MSMNTRILAAEYDYHAPATLDEALTILAEKPNVKILAGGTDLIVKMKTGALTEIEHMLDIKRIPGLDKIKPLDCCDGLEIGALAKLSDIEEHAEVKEKYTCLYEALKAMAAISVRNMGTLAGNIGNASPVADGAAALVAYDAKVVLQSKKGGERKVNLDEFFKGPGITVMQPDEMITAICIPAPAAHTGAAYLKKTRVKPDIAKLSVGVVITNDNGKCSNCRITMAAVAATPLYLKEISQSLVGQTITAELIAKTAQEVADFIRPIDDNRTTAVYRKDITAVVAEEALTTAWKRAGGAL